MNDDALVPPSFLADLKATFESDPAIGCVGVRAIEAGYIRQGEGIGRIDRSGRVIGNFDADCAEPVEVEHVYGFCYAFSREALERAGLCDEVLLARPYSSGERIETDHCLSMREAGFKVIYNPRIAVEHLAKPRGDYSEVSPAWKLNHVRNTLYLLLKHFGPFGRGGAALRFATRDLGVRSAVLRPSAANWAYVLNGLRGRASGVAHYLLWLSQARSQRGGRKWAAGRRDVAGEGRRWVPTT